MVCTRKRSALDGEVKVFKRKAALEATSVGVDLKELVPEKIISRPSKVRVVEGEPTLMVLEA